MIRLLIADDHQILREGLKHVVSQSQATSGVGEAADARLAAPTGLDASRRDVLLLDVSMPGPGRARIIAEVKAAQPRVRDPGAQRPSRKGTTRAACWRRGPTATSRRTIRRGAGLGDSPGARRPAIPDAVAGAGTRAGSRAQGRARTHEMLSNREYQVFLASRRGGGRPTDRGEAAVEPEDGADLSLAHPREDEAAEHGRDDLLRGEPQAWCLVSRPSRAPAKTDMRLRGITRQHAPLCDCTIVPTRATALRDRT